MLAKQIRRKFYGGSKNRFCQRQRPGAGDRAGLSKSREVLMVAYMNEEAWEKTQRDRQSPLLQPLAQRPLVQRRRVGQLPGSQRRFYRLRYRHDLDSSHTRSAAPPATKAIRAAFSASARAPTGMSSANASSIPKSLQKVSPRLQSWQATKNSNWAFPKAASRQ